METLSAIPNNPIEVVAIRMMGPIIASELFIIKAFSTSFTFRINSAANTSTLPEIILNNAIPIIAFSININIVTSHYIKALLHYMQESGQEGQSLFKKGLEAYEKLIYLLVCNTKYNELEAY
jgi:hypothetical protein